MWIVQRCILALLILVLSMGCDPSAKREQALGEATAQLDFPAGTLQGSVIWNGATVSGLGIETMFATLPGITGNYVGSDGHYILADLPPGNYTLGLQGNGCNQADYALGQLPVTVSAGNTTNADFDITSTAGRVIGRITVNGAPLPYPNISIDSLCGSWRSDNAGNFSHFLPPGTYTAHVSSSSLLGSFSFEVVAGQVTDLGSIDFQSGTLQGSVIWNGATVSGLGIETMFATLPGITGNYVGSDGHYILADLPPGNYTLDLQGNGCNQADYALGQLPVTVSAANTTNANFDITSTAGRVVGRITVNGAPLPYPNISIDSLCGSWRSDADGHFAHFLPPGTYTAHVSSSSLLGSFSFDVVPGQVTDLGSVDFQSGTLQGSVIWNGTTVSGLGIETMFATLPGIAGNYVGSDGHYILADLPPGSYTLGLQGNGCNQADYALGQLPVMVSAANTTNADFDITSTAGRVVGKITVNGAPLSYPNISIDSLCGSWRSDNAGNFSHFLPPGSYVANVSSSAKLGSFAFQVIAGQITDVDIGTTLAGSNVSVQLSGGIASVGGISLLFSQVASAGQTTVVESGAGPPPPTGFRIVGLLGQPRYWDIDTTATYTPPIVVCIHYDPAQVNGQEKNLRLVHDDGTGFKDITTTRDLDADIICGEASSLSPFAVVEPLLVDSDGDGVADTDDACPLTPVKALVNAQGCSLDQIVPCGGPPGRRWKNHGEYVKSFQAALARFVAAGLVKSPLTEQLSSNAGRSRCGG